MKCIEESANKVEWVKMNVKGNVYKMVVRPAAM